MNTTNHVKTADPRRMDRKRDILREFFAAALVLAAIKSGDSSVAPVSQSARPR